ncbi:MAG: phosphotransferase [Lachnospiraceae bacterium]|nr:phosphotransferase [Lachnospiraceae bacterium]
MNIDYIVVQAGGKGTRLEYLTKNKPKALVPVENLPMLFHLFRKYPDKKYVIIADYHKEVLREYLASFAKVKYQVVDAEGTGTCSGVRQAIQQLPHNVPFMLVWSDLILPQDFILPQEEKDYIGISQTFPCRWSYQNGKLVEEKSTEKGVAGFFLFTEKSKLQDVPVNGELVRWMQEKHFVFEEVGLAGTREFGLLEEYNKLAQEKCRPFNKMTFDGDVAIKEGIDEQGRKLAVRECAWYEAARGKNITILPKVYGTNPLRMERIKGENIYECQLAYEQKREILQKLVEALKKLHDAEQVPADTFSIKEAYYNKTIQRLSAIRDLVPFADRKVITVNGKQCRNVYFYKRELEKALERLHCDSFCLIHGDCTFSNMMLREDGTPVLIDPRGYFGHTEIYGDPMYDWAKLYYSLVGNYDRFNLKDFRLDIGEEEVTLQITSNQWEDMEEDFFRMTGVDRAGIKLLHAVIWLSLTTYAWQDYDSICGAFYNGLYYLEDVL